MKTVTQLALTGLVTALFATGSAFAGDSEVRMIDNHHGTVTYLSHPVREPVTIGFFSQRAGRGVGPASHDVKRERIDSRNVATPHGTVTYYAPAK